MENHVGIRSVSLRELLPFIRLCMVWGLLILLCAGCCSAPPVKKSGKNVAAQLAQSFCRNDSKHFLSCLPPSVKKDFGEKEFSASRKKICTQLGEPGKNCFMGSLEHPFFDISLWKISFERKDSKGNPVMQDALFQVVCGKGENGNQIISFGFL